jgi:hypothetical protein
MWRGGANSWSDAADWGDTASGWNGAAKRRKTWPREPDFPPPALGPREPSCPPPPPRPDPRDPSCPSPGQAQNAVQDTMPELGSAGRADYVQAVRSWLRQHFTLSEMEEMFS